MKGIRFPSLVSLLDFIYVGEVKVHQDEVQEFLEVATEFELEFIKKMHTSSQYRNIKSHISEHKTSGGHRKILNFWHPAPIPMESCTF